MILKTIFLLILLLIQTGYTSNSQASPYQLSPTQEWTILGTGAGLGLVGYLAEQGRNAPTAQSLSALDSKNIPGFDRHFAGHWDTRLQSYSDTLMAIGVLSPIALLPFHSSDARVLCVMYAETMLLTGGGVGLAKGSVTRYRPYAYGNTAPLSASLQHDTKRSFFSGHAAFTSAGLVLSAKLFSDYYPASAYKPLVWGSAISMSLTTAFLRVEGGKHFPSDVIVGLIWGSSIGYFIPVLHKSQNPIKLFPYLFSNESGIKLHYSFP